MKRKIKARIEFEPRDLWIGVYWNYHTIGTLKHLDIYICIIPIFPIHITVIQAQLLHFKRGPKVYNKDDPRLKFQEEEIKAVSYLADAATAALEGER